MRSWRHKLGLMAGALVAVCALASVAQALPPRARVMGNAFNECDEHPEVDPKHWQISAGYTAIWFRGPRFPPLATTGSITDQLLPGALGQPNTVVLNDDTVESGARSAFRGTVTYWLVEPELACLEAIVFIMQKRERSQSFNSDAGGNPVLARPYFDLVDGRETADARALPGLLQGSLFDSFTTQLMGAEVNFRRYNSSIFEGSNFGFLLGGRWLKLDERYVNYDTSIDPGFTSTTFSDTFVTNNQFVGCQVGCEYQYRWAEQNEGALLQKFTLSLGAKVAVGANFQTVRISGETVHSDPGNGVFTTDPQGLFAQPSNVGVYHKTRAAALPEFTAKFSFDMMEHLRLSAGYTYFFLSHSVQPGDQIDRNIQINQLQANDTPALGPLPPGFRQSVFGAHMLNFAVELLF